VTSEAAGSAERRCCNAALKMEDKATEHRRPLEAAKGKDAASPIQPPRGACISGFCPLAEDNKFVLL